MTTNQADRLGAALWALVASLLARFAVVFGALADLDPAAVRRAAAWLRDLETLARRLLFAEAVGLAAGKTYAPRAARATAAGASAAWRALRTAHPEHDQATPFRIRLCALSAPRHDTPRDHHDAPRRPMRAAALARRAAALTALLADPAPFARKLARRIARRRALLPALLSALRRYRPHRRLGRVLGPMFSDAPENLIGLIRLPPPRDGPYAVTLTPDLGALIAPEPRPAARRERASPLAPRARLSAAPALGRRARPSH